MIAHEYLAYFLREGSILNDADLQLLLIIGSIFRSNQQKKYEKKKTITWLTI